ncbi:amino acid permease [Picosynechococcus sp. PCC 8807]|uniref:amino acid permease n=1 Tax=Picosynechococcus sp. PCC 8807 TaxID=195248 RepID=UPI00081039E8|nr:amino acid permease [Picosynechococcus sp. PCC 8807]ANV92186.1 Na-K-Cl cotransporter [Picosynechococcus sp. PCC 8807]
MPLKTSSTAVTTPADKAGLGMFGGVFTPSLLTILGVIMYLRFGWVVGNVGLFGTWLIVTMAVSITFLTTLSICAIATDRVVRTGGAYFMISRSLGIETGGAVGIPLYFAQALSVALYTIGFAESVVNAFGPFNQTYIALIVTILVAVLAITSAEIAIKAQYFIMAIIALSLVSLAFGSPLEVTQLEPWGTDGGESFWTVFAVFFPAVTGIMAGVNMSGDLKEPTKAIPTGTLAAVGVGYLIYMALPFFLATRADANTLVENPLIMQQIAFWGPSILLGIWGATLSSAIGSILGAPRILQALARDRVLPRWLSFLGKGSGPNNEPRIGTAITLGIVTVAVMVGDLNLIAPVLSMFFLTTYLVLNIAAGVEGFLDSPSFRPLFAVHWSFSLLGALGCLAVMFLINPVATIVAGLIVAMIFLWIQRRELKSTWGDARRGIWMMLLRTSLFQLGHHPDPRTWRPHMLVLSGAPTRRWGLIELADGLNRNRGLFTIASILPMDSRSIRQQQQMEKSINDYLQERNIQALVRVLTAQDPFVGVERLVEIYGLGPIVPDTVLLGNNETPENRSSYCQLIHALHRAERNVIIYREKSQPESKQHHQIDVWWGGLHANGALMMILAELLRDSMEWRSAQIYLKLVVPDQSAAATAKQNINVLVQTLRIDAEICILVAEGRSFDEILSESSRNADQVILGIAEPNENFCDYYASIEERIHDLPSTMLVLAAPSFAFAEVLKK